MWFNIQMKHGTWIFFLLEPKHINPNERFPIRIEPGNLCHEDN